MNEMKDIYNVSSDAVKKALDEIHAMNIDELIDKIVEDLQKEFTVTRDGKNIHVESPYAHDPNEHIEKFNKVVDIIDKYTGSEAVSMVLFKIKTRLNSFEITAKY